MSQVINPTTADQPDVYIVSDFLGERRFVVPPSEINWSHHDDVSPAILKFEALKGVRLKDGGNPYMLWRIFNEWERRHDPEITFAEYCARLHPKEIDLVRGPAADDSLSARRHSIDFRSVVWDGTPYAFTANQAEIVGYLWAAADNGTPEIGDAWLQAEAELGDKVRIKDVFRSDGKQHPAWDTMIVSGSTKGTRRLAEPKK